jgi:ATP-binding cassette subfamily C protein
MPRFGFSTSEALERGRDVDTVRGFLGSQGPSALFDLPWIPIYLAFVYFLHPLLGALTLGGACVLTVLTVLSEILTKRLHASTRTAAIARNTIADSNARNADILKAMGFADRAVNRFTEANSEHLELQTRTNDISGTISAISRVLRMVLQSAVLGLGAYLTIKGELSAGAIIACSVSSARALAPVDLAIGNWKSFVAARMAFRRLRETVIALAIAVEPMKLPAPSRSFSVEKITIAAPGTGQVILSDVSFELQQGDALGIIGPSAGGKTTMVRALTGIWPLLRGHVRLDGADLVHWRADEIGQHIGYLPNSNLDAEGEAALTQAIEGIRARGGIAIVIAHRASALAAVDLLAIVQNGRIASFGAKRDVMTTLQSAAKLSPEVVRANVRRPA